MRRVFVPGQRIPEVLDDLLAEAGEVDVGRHGIALGAAEVSWEVCTGMRWGSDAEMVGDWDGASVDTVRRGVRQAIPYWRRDGHGVQQSSGRVQ